MDEQNEPVTFKVTVETDTAREIERVMAETKRNCWQTGNVFPCAT